MFTVLACQHYNKIRQHTVRSSPYKRTVSITVRSISITMRSVSITMRSVSVEKRSVSITNN